MRPERPGLPARSGPAGFAGAALCQKLDTCHYAQRHGICPAAPGPDDQMARHQLCRLLAIPGGGTAKRLVEPTA
ncbi:hypothetical protein [Rhizobium sp. RU20A]|uniref:hypothetical protein n=1 Tax=Rhizobium sp. RU20A TaxID=1907412 RepID=UPI00122C3815|nr:hypothetical protein [Rhizobium sp. RU20A]